MTQMSNGGNGNGGDTKPFGPWIWAGVPDEPQRSAEFMPGDRVKTSDGKRGLFVTGYDDPFYGETCVVQWEGAEHVASCRPISLYHDMDPVRP